MSVVGEQVNLGIKDRTLTFVSIVHLAQVVEPDEFFSNLAPPKSQNNGNVLVPCDNPLDLRSV